MRRERKNNRHVEYDYSQDGWYFVTICIQNMQCVFGCVCDENILLNNFGEIAEKVWLDIPNHFQAAALDEYIIMPNHIHGIVVIDRDDHQINVKNTGTGKNHRDDNFRIHVNNTVGTRHTDGNSHIDVKNTVGVAYMRPLRDDHNKSYDRSKMLLSKIIQQYKSTVTRTIRPITPTFSWQRSFYDRVIRSDQELYNIRAYIRSNLKRWRK